MLCSLLQATRLLSRTDLLARWRFTSLCPHSLQLPCSKTWNPFDWQWWTYRVTIALSRPQPSRLLFVRIFQRPRSFPTFLHHLRRWRWEFEKLCLQSPKVHLQKWGKTVNFFTNAPTSKRGTFGKIFLTKKALFWRSLKWAVDVLHLLQNKKGRRVSNCKFLFWDTLYFLWFSQYFLWHTTNCSKYYESSNSKTILFSDLLYILYVLSLS